LAFWKKPPVAQLEGSSSGTVPGTAELDLNKPVGLALKCKDPVTSVVCRHPTVPRTRAAWGAARFGRRFRLSSTAHLAPWRPKLDEEEAVVIKGVIFDVDGTLVDSVDLHAAAWQEAFRHFGQETDFAEVRSQISKGGDQLLPVFIPPNRLEQIQTRSLQTDCRDRWAD
jgi:hypothetical protein